MRRRYESTGRGRGAPGLSKSRREIASRLAWFSSARADGRTVEGAALLVGVCARTGWRYEALRKRRRADATG